MFIKKGIVLFLVAFIVHVLCSDDDDGQDTTPTCEESCGVNEVFTPVNGTLPCQETCNNEKQKDFCPITKGCQCKPNYIRHPDTYECIPRSGCPGIFRTKSCGQFEKWCNCQGCQERICDLKNKINESAACIPSCVCMDGFSRDRASGKCIRWSSCGECPPGHQLNPSNQECEISCNICRQNERFSVKNNRCVCMPDFYSKNGRCVSRKTRARQLCPPGLVVNSNGLCVLSWVN